MAKYLVTGGCGFIGSHLVDLLVEKGHQVRVIDNCINSSPRFLPPEVEFLPASITDEEEVKHAVKGVDGIFHLAALVSVTDSIDHWHSNHLVNGAATIRLFELSKGVPTIFASSAAVYGNRLELPHLEEMQPSPLSPYAVDKYGSEMQAKLAWELFQTPTLCFRFFNVYGPRQNPSSPYSGVISKFAEAVTQNQPLTIFGDGKQGRDFIFVKDVAESLFKAIGSLHRGAGVYNLCTGQGITINDLAQLMARIAQKKIEIHYKPERPGEIRISLGDPSKAEKELAIRAKTSLEEGLFETLKWLSNPSSRADKLKQTGQIR